MEPEWSFEVNQNKEAITTINLQSPLLKLPQEIKDQIYVLVCGGNLLHFYSAPHLQGGFSHFICLSKTTEEEAQSSFDASKSAWFDEACANRHEDCSYNPEPISEKPTLDLRFLRTCHQLYGEAKHFCYTANIFSFGWGDHFVQFATSVSWLSYVRSIFVRTHRNNCRLARPNSRETLQNISSKLMGVRFVHLDLQQLHFSGSCRYDRAAEESSPLTEELLCFAGTALKAVTVTISDPYFCDWRSPEIVQRSHDDAQSLKLNRWTMAQKQEYSRFLRNAILQHRGK